MSNRGGVDAKFGGAGSQATGGMGLGGSPRQESSGGALGPVTRGWRKRGLAAYRRTRKANRLAKPAKAPAVNPAPRVRPPAKPKPDWLDTLTEDQVNKLVNSQAYSKYHPAFAEIASQKRQLAAQKQRNDDWFRQYQQQIGQASLNNAYVYGGAAGIVQQGAQAQAGQDEANRQALAQQQMADAQNRGVAYSPANDVTAQQAASSRLGSQNSFAALLAQQGAGDVARLQQQSGVVVPLQQRESQAASDAQLRALGAKALDLLKEKGDYKVQLKDSKREAERKNRLELAAFNLKGSQAQQDYQVALAKFKAQQEKDRKAMEKDAYQRKYGLGPYKPAASKGSGGSGGGSGGSKAKTPAKPSKPSAAYYSGIRQFQGVVNQYGTGQSDFKVASTNRKVPRVVVLAAHEYARTGRVSGRVARMWLDAFGTPLPIAYRNGSRKAPYPNANPKTLGGNLSVGTN